MLQANTWLPRTEGAVRLSLGARAGHTTITRLRQAGAARVRFPSAKNREVLEAVLLNTAGGLTGGDCLSVDVLLAPGADATLASAAAEKIYRSRSGEATIQVGLDVASGARLAWLPQPTIVFDRARLARRTDVQLGDEATLLAMEILIFGRAAMGEDVHLGLCRDAWRVKRNGKLIFADTLHVSGPIARVLDRPGTLDGARAVATILYVAPDAGGRVAEARELLAQGQCTAGVSTWSGTLVVRAVARDGAALQSDMLQLIGHLSGRPPPRVWNC